MKIEILTSDGSPLGVTSKTVWGDSYRIGVGGAELALITMCEEWTKAGHDVVLYNDPHEGGVSPFEQRSVATFDPNMERDVLIVFRSPNVRVATSKGLKVWWSTDQYTRGDFKEFAPLVDKIVCISPYHQKYFADTYGITNTVFIDLPVRIDDYELTKYEKVSNRMIFSSISDRGLDNLRRMYPIIRREIPDLSLVITSDYRLWGTNNDGVSQHRVKWLPHEGIEFLGAISRERLIQEQLKAEVMLYPCNYEELFCISVAEAQYAGVYPVTSGIGALETTNMGTVLKVDPNDPRNDVTFVDVVTFLLKDRGALKFGRGAVTGLAYDRFRPEIILKQWDKVFENETTKL